MSLPPGLGYICTPSDYERSLRDPSIRCLTRGDSFGLVVVVGAGVLSLLSVLCMFFRILHSGAWTWKQPAIHDPLIPTELLVLSTLFADLIQSIGGIHNVKWIVDGKVVVGDFCNSQGILKNIGETGVALSTLAIAVHTVVVVVTTWQVTVKITHYIIAVIWSFILIVVVVGNTVNHGRSFQAPVPHWCWISKDFLVWRLIAEYLWFWIAFIFSVVTYIPLHLEERGYIILNNKTWWKCSFVRKPQPNNKISSGLLVYPLAYSIIVIPLSVTRWLGFTEEMKHGANTIPAEYNFIALALFGLSGFLNVLVLFTTRTRLFDRRIPVTTLSGVSGDRV